MSLQRLRVIELDAAVLDRTPPCDSPALQPQSCESVPLVAHVALVDGRRVGVAVTEKLFAQPGQEETAMSSPLLVSRAPCMEEAAVHGRMFAGLQVWEHLVARQLKWLDRHGLCDLHIVVPECRLRDQFSQLSGIGARLLNDRSAAQRAGLSGDVRLIRLEIVSGLRHLRAKAAAAGLLQRIARTTRTTPAAMASTQRAG